MPCLPGRWIAVLQACFCVHTAAAAGRDLRLAARVAFVAPSGAAAGLRAPGDAGRCSTSRQKLGIRQQSRLGLFGPLMETGYKEKLRTLHDAPPQLESGNLQVVCLHDAFPALSWRERALGLSLRFGCRWMTCTAYTTGFTVTQMLRRQRCFYMVALAQVAFRTTRAFSTQSAGALFYLTSAAAGHPRQRAAR